MLFSERSIRAIPFAVVLTLLVGCVGTADEEMATATSADMPSFTAISSGFMLPPSGITGTPADNVTDPALRGLPNPNPTVIKDWGKLPNGREWGSTAGADIGPDGHVWAYDRCGGGLDGGADRLPVDTRAGDPAEQVEDAEADDGADRFAHLTESREGSRTDRQSPV